MLISKEKMMIAVIAILLTGFYAGASINPMYNPKREGIYREASLVSYRYAEDKDTSKLDTNVIITPDMDCLRQMGLDQYWFIIKDNTTDARFSLIKFDSDFNMHTQLTEKDIDVLLNYLVMLRKK